ncbi:probable inactive 1-aminocyclopropane-1-carboxylate synthase-like protein 2 [Penaeus chinensis]|uniref:probable inactive 1-aminocyclopropane-1-carboxylate synthase-like protein 2 n=1 Tax=Penaeus chinensis TaxID=139456 RepID=UPI001FB821DA|nr:probable inactive 1-aminocyclopropane-1-carboxylate synthase-like protein 2 [Penaeus chinensis]XP_047497709.1 probable inactive 1-aminocyclopropane-1-carboxylate synthase-like protein 2 [Penaeus chinensis]
MSLAVLEEEIRNHIEGNVYDKEHNPEGIIVLSQAVNRILVDDVLERLHRDDCSTLKKKHLLYSPSHGTKEMREACATFLTRQHFPMEAVHPDHLIIMPGVTACMESLARSLCNPGDVVLSPSPIYHRIKTNFEDAGARIVHMVTTQNNNFELTPEQVEGSIVEAQSEGECVRACVLANPQNPLGQVMTPSFLRAILEICARYEVHVVVDEIFAFSVFASDVTFTSLLALEDLPDPHRTHVFWGFSKDFCIAGLRMGLIHTVNPQLLTKLKLRSHYHSTSQQTQHAVATMISDTVWCDNFLDSSRKKLAEAYARACDMMEELQIQVLEAKGAFFLWANFQPFLTEPTVEAEYELCRAFLYAGVSIIPGTKFHCSEPGWFRILFSVPEEELQEGLRRLGAVISNRR